MLLVHLPAEPWAEISFWSWEVGKTLRVREPMLRAWWSYKETVELREERKGTLASCKKEEAMSSLS